MDGPVLYFNLFGLFVLSAFSLTSCSLIESDWQVDMEQRGRMFEGPVTEGSVSSIFSCIVKCLDTDESCSVVTYIKDTGSCRGHVTYNSSLFTPWSQSVTWVRDMTGVEGPKEVKDAAFYTAKCGPYTLHMESQLCYDMKNELETWDNAQNRCVAEGGRLLVIDTAAKKTYLQSVFAGGFKMMFVGAQDRDVEGTWNWLNGVPLTSGDWLPHEPNQFTTEEDCGAIRENFGTGIMDLSCGQITYFICEKDIWS